MVRLVLLWTSFLFLAVVAAESFCLWCTITANQKYAHYAVFPVLSMLLNLILVVLGFKAVRAGDAKIQCYCRSGGGCRWMCMYRVVAVLCVVLMALEIFFTLHATRDGSVDDEDDQWWFRLMAQLRGGLLAATVVSIGSVTALLCLAPPPRDKESDSRELTIIDNTFIAGGDDFW